MLNIINKSLHQPCLVRNIINSSVAGIRNYSQNVENNENEASSNSPQNVEKGGFAKAFEKFSMSQQEVKQKEPDLPFATLFKNSKFVEVSF